MSVNYKDYHAASTEHPSDRGSASAQIAAASYDQMGKDDDKLMPLPMPNIELKEIDGRDKGCVL